MRRASKRDANHAPIADALRNAGCRVIDLAAVGCGVPDLLVCEPTWPFDMHLIEIKNTNGRGNKLTPEQVKFHAEWKGKLHVVTTVDEALCAVGLGG